MLKTVDAPFAQYESRAPAPQNAVDALPGWQTALPVAELKTGATPLASDPRIEWMIAAAGGVAGSRLLELGPLDGGHTAMLHRADAARIDAIEANRLAFLRCLVTKELLGLDRARFHLGDFSRGFGALAGRYDLVLASGVLYHMADPVALLTELAAMTDRLYLWTHLYDASALGADDPRASAFTGRVETRRAHGIRLRLHERGYLGTESVVGFCGGPRDKHVWMEREGLLALLGALGFDDISVAHERADGPGGPSLSILAMRGGDGQ
ncbi:MAG: class I SAM-dependent methyltransferase [Paracoccaceae bacterium]